MNIAVWGCGNMGRSAAQALTATGRARVAAVCDVRPEARADLSARYEAQAVGSGTDLLEIGGLEGIIIALPPDLHEPAVRDAAEAGLDIFVEKPMSTTAAGSRRMMDACTKAGVSLTVGQVLRYYEPYRSILRWNAQGRFGRLIAASIWRVLDGRKLDPSHWRATLARSGGPLLEIGAHELDMLACLLGKPATVGCAAAPPVAGNSDWPSFMSMHIIFRGGGIGAYECGAGSRVGRYGFRLCFEEATLVSDAAFDRDALRAYGAEGEQPEVPESRF